MSAEREFVDALLQLRDKAAEKTGEPAFLVGCLFDSDPSPTSNEKRKHWWPRVFTGKNLDFDENVYLCVSAVRRDADGNVNRKTENCVAGLCLMIDDIGSGPAAKFPLSTLRDLPPTALIETSPDNYQAVYIFREPELNIEKFDSLISGFIKRKFLNRDTGMAGVNRVFRPPLGRNRKAKHRQPDGEFWKVRLAMWKPERRFTVDQIASAFMIPMTEQRRRRAVGNGGEDPFFERKQTVFAASVAQMIAAGDVQRIKDKSAARAMLDAVNAVDWRRAASAEQRIMQQVNAVTNSAGWFTVRCPFVNGGRSDGKDIAPHTGGIDSGAAVGVPTEEFKWVGRFRCHHGHGAELSIKNILLTKAEGPLSDALRLMLHKRETDQWNEAVEALDAAAEEFEKQKMEMSR